MFVFRLSKLTGDALYLWLLSRPTAGWGGVLGMSIFDGSLCSLGGLRSFVSCTEQHIYNLFLLSN
jgi:hypothetical protein